MKYRISIRKGVFYPEVRIFLSWRPIVAKNNYRGSYEPLFYNSIERAIEQIENHIKNGIENIIYYEKY